MNFNCTLSFCILTYVWYDLICIVPLDVQGQPVVSSHSCFSILYFCHKLGTVIFFCYSFEAASGGRSEAVDLIAEEQPSFYKFPTLNLITYSLTACCHKLLRELIKLKAFVKEDILVEKDSCSGIPLNLLRRVCGEIRRPAWCKYPFISHFSPYRAQPQNAHLCNTWKNSNLAP